MRFKKHDNANCVVIGLGYVGLPLAVEIAREKIRNGDSRIIVGFDISKDRVCSLRNKVDSTKEIAPSDYSLFEEILFTDNKCELPRGDVFIVTVPTPVDSSNNPDFSFLKNASMLVGEALKRRAEKVKDYEPIVIYESTVYPGATEELCVPIIESYSGLRLNKGFACGYSPERINPGDKEHTIRKVMKVTSGSSREAAEWIDLFYQQIVDAGTYAAQSIRVAEAAKVIENTQRDLNIALINEFALIFERLGIDTLDVLEAAGSKWNFLPFRPGLVGGHCIGVDPYYLTYKAEQVGYNPELVLAGRRINDGMGSWICQRILREKVSKSGITYGSTVLVMGLTFKEECPDVRNSKVFHIISEFIQMGMKVTVIDPVVQRDSLGKDLDFKLVASTENCSAYDFLVVAVAHKQFVGHNSQWWQNLKKKDGILLDLKGIVPREVADIRM